MDMKHKKIFHAVLFTLLLTVVLSCDQDSVFADIAVEPPPVDPRIEGSSTGFVVLNGSLYMSSVGSSTIHRYKNGQWDAFSADGRIAGLDAAAGKLYALLYYGSDRLDVSLVEINGSNPVTIDKGDAEAYSIQSIIACGDRLFAGGNRGGIWDIFQLNGDKLTRLISNAAPLTGAASIGSDYYLSTAGKGIYRVSNPIAAIPGSEGNITGILNVNGAIVAVTWNGGIIVNTGARFVEISRESYYYTGAMALYKENSGGQWRDSILLLGVQTTGSYDKGYRELSLVNGAMPGDGRSPVRPGGENSSVKPENLSKYEASLARYSVHHILQVPNEVDNLINSEGWEPLIFASTTGKGVYVLMNGLWNAQD